MWRATRGHPPQRVRRGLAVLLLFAVISSAVAASMVLATPVTRSAAAAAVYETVLDNGVTVVVMPRGSDPPVASVQVWFAAGSGDDPEGKEGLAHFFEHMVFGGSQRLAPGEFDRRISGVGGYSNASTSYDFTNYYATVPSEHVEELIALLGELTTSPLFPQNLLEREREVIYREQEIRLDSPVRQAFEKMMEHLMAGHPYARSALGDRGSVGSITREDMLAFIEREYVPQRTFVVIVGDVDPERVTEAARDAFGSIPTRPVPQRENPPLAELQGRRPEPIVRSLKQTHLALGWRGTAMKSPDVYAQEVLITMLGVGRTSRLHRRLVREEGLVTWISSNGWFFRDHGALGVIAQMPPGHEDRVEQMVLEEIRRLQEGDFTEAEVERAKTLLLLSYASGLESTDAMASALGEALVTVGDWRWVLEYPGRIRAVNKEDVMRAARDYLAADRYVRVVVGPEAEGSAGASAAACNEGSCIDGSSDPSAGEAHLAGAATVQETTVERVVLDNGHVFILQNRPYAPVVAVETFARAGRRYAPQGQAALPQLVLRTMLAGTRELSRDELMERVESLGGYLSGSAGQDFGQITLEGLPERLPQLLALYADVLQAPALSEAEFAFEREQLRRELMASNDDFRNRVREGFLEGLYGAHPYGVTNQAVLASLDAITVEDLREFHRVHYAPNQLVTAVVGPIDLAATKDLVEQLFGRRDRVEAPMPPMPPVEERAGFVDVVQTGDTGAGWLELGFLAPSLTEVDLPAMEVLRSLLAGGLSSMLYQELRDKLAVVYSVSALYPYRDGPSYFVVTTSTPPTQEAIDQATEAIWRVLEEQLAEIDEEQLAMARERVVGGFAIGRQQASSQATLLAAFEARGLGYEAVERYADEVRKVDRDRVLALARQLFRRERAVRSSVLPPQE